MSALLVAALFACIASAQDAAPLEPGTPPAPGRISQPAPKGSPQPPPEPPPLRTTGEHWKYFVDELASPLTFAGAIFNAGFSQVTNSDPRYGTNSIAFAQRVGASAANIISEDFFGDFLVASAFHEDPTYLRRGEQYGFWYRVGYAISRAFVIRTASGGNGFNWDNVLGTAASVGLSNAYYPAPSRTGGAMLINFGTTIAGNGFVNLAPEFWPDFERKFFRRHSSHKSAAGQSTN